MYALSGFAACLHCGLVSLFHLAHFGESKQRHTCHNFYPLELASFSTELRSVLNRLVGTVGYSIDLRTVVGDRNHGEGLDVEIVGLGYIEMVKRNGFFLKLIKGIS